MNFFKKVMPVAQAAVNNMASKAPSPPAPAPSKSMMPPPKMINRFFQAAKNMRLSNGGKVSSASKRADGIAQRGKTKGRMC
jgi:hypothetical protein